MNKVVISELVVLAVLLIVAFCLVSTLSTGAPAQVAVSPEPQIVTPQASEDPVQSAQDKQPIIDPEGIPEPTWMMIPEDRALTAKEYFVFDVTSDAFMTQSGSAQDRVYPASVTKLFTCYVGLQYLDADQVIKVGDELDYVVGGSSVAELRRGDKLTVSQLVEAMLLPSGNDAAYVMAVNAAKAMLEASGETFVGSPTTKDYINLFMEEMNHQAAQVGMNDTHFANPDGIHKDNHYMSVSDLALLGKLVVHNDLIVEKAMISFDDQELIKRGDGSPDHAIWKNTNQIINPESKYYCPYCIGLKTGATPNAGSCLLSAFNYKGRMYIIGVFGCPDTDARFEDTLQLFNQMVAAL